MDESGSGTNSKVMERRRFLRQAATVAWAAPTIVTLMSSRAGAQVGGISCGTVVGGACSQDPPCGTALPSCQPDPTDVFGECICFAI